jgi:hypothetical protein
VSFVPSHKSRLLVGDFHLAAYTKSVQQPNVVDMLDTTVLTDTSKTFIPGQDGSTLTVNGLYDVAAFSDLTSWKTATAQPVTYAPSGVGLSSELWMVDGLESQFTTGAAANGLATFDLAVQASGVVDFGVSLAAMAIITGNTNGSTHDGGAASTGGGVAHLHITAFSGFSDLNVYINDSANDSTWAEILAFTQATGVTAERKAITGTVRRYIRFVALANGTGSATIQVGFARR